MPQRRWSGPDSAGFAVRQPRGGVEGTVGEREAAGSRPAEEADALAVEAGPTGGRKGRREVEERRKKSWRRTKDGGGAWRARRDGIREQRSDATSNDRRDFMGDRCRWAVPRYIRPSDHGAAKPRELLIKRDLLPHTFSALPAYIAFSPAPALLRPRQRNTTGASTTQTRRATREVRVAGPTDRRPPTPVQSDG